MTQEQNQKPDGCICHYYNKFERRHNSKCPVHGHRMYSLRELKHAYTKGWQDRAFLGDRTEFNRGAFDVKIKEYIMSLNKEQA